MKQTKNLLLLMFLLVIIMCSPPRTDVSQGVVTMDEVTTISLKPEKGKKIVLSEIAQTIKLVFLETTDRSLISDIVKLDMEDNGDFFILNDHDRFVYMFDSAGSFKQQIGQKGEGPGEIQFPYCFALNKKKKEILLTSNFNALNRYNYDGTFLGADLVDYSFVDLFVADDGCICLYTGKNCNFLNKNQRIPFNLWIVDNEKNITLFFPYDPLLFPNGSTRMNTQRPFDRMTDQVSFCYLFCDTIYSIKGRDIKPTYVINFGKNTPPVDLNTLAGDEVFELLTKENDFATYIQDWVETDSFIRFKYGMSLHMYNVYYDKKTKKTLEGILENDILGGEITFCGKKGNKFIGYINAFDILVKEKAADYIDKETLEKLQSLGDENNPILVELELKQIEQ